MNVLVLLLMIITIHVTIYYSQKQISENKESTDVQLQKMQDQITSYRESTDRLILANERERKLRHISRMETLQAELEINLHICENEIIASYKKNSNLDSLPVPESRFVYSMLKATLSSGEIIDNKTRNSLWNSLRSMEIINSLLTQALQILHMEHISDPKNQILSSGRRVKVKQLVRDSVDLTSKLNEKIKESIFLVRTMKLSSISDIQTSPQ